ncbi:hypothetical protein K435DRAFT_965055 [Dendrothele bispora CBS 962.96]|uniref:Protein kinase domain-containing protein n=1 Tax=Dendrothele bispora (strain CBS 962.96) TaxID=1314807 RepID=A0A4V4HGC2_DENBC|nr:hypothetical protein K435DRAFT_965055 [Dendrothele bispora CBS 962.96]
MVSISPASCPGPDTFGRKMSFAMKGKEAEKERKDGVKIEVRGVDVEDGEQDPETSLITEREYHQVSPESDDEEYDSECTLDLDELGLDNAGAPLERMIQIDGEVVVDSGWNSEDSYDEDAEEDEVNEEEAKEKARVLQALYKACQEARFQHVDSDEEPGFDDTEDEDEDEFDSTSDSESDTTSVGYDDLDFERLVDDLFTTETDNPPPGVLSTLCLPRPLPPLTLLPLPPSSSTLLLLLSLNDPALRSDPWNPVPRILCAVDRSLDTDAFGTSTEKPGTIHLFLKHLAPFEPFVPHSSYSPTTGTFPSRPSALYPTTIVGVSHTLSQWIDFCRQILEGLVFLHECGVAHRGFKPSSEKEKHADKEQDQATTPLFMMDISADPEAVNMFFVSSPRVLSASYPSPHSLPALLGHSSKTVQQLSFDRNRYPVKYYFTNLYRAVKVLDPKKKNSSSRADSVVSSELPSPSGISSNSDSLASPMTSSPVSEKHPQLDPLALPTQIPPPRPRSVPTRSKSLIPSPLSTSQPQQALTDSTIPVTRPKSQQGTSRGTKATAMGKVSSLSVMTSPTGGIEHSLGPSSPSLSSASGASAPTSRSGSRSTSVSAKSNRRCSATATANTNSVGSAKPKKSKHPLFIRDVIELGELFEKEVLPRVRKLDLGVSGPGEKASMLGEEVWEGVDLDSERGNKEGRGRKGSITSATLGEADKAALVRLRDSSRAPRGRNESELKQLGTVTGVLMSLIHMMKTGNLTAEEARKNWEDGTWSVLKSGGIRDESESGSGTRSAVWCRAENEITAASDTTPEVVVKAGLGVEREQEGSKENVEKKDEEDDNQRQNLLVDRRPSIVVDLTDDLNDVPSPPPLSPSPSPSASRRGSMQLPLSPMMREQEKQKQKPSEQLGKVGFGEISGSSTATTTTGAARVPDVSRVTTGQFPSGQVPAQSYAHRLGPGALTDEVYPTQAQVVKDHYPQHVLPQHRQQQQQQQQYPQIPISSGQSTSYSYQYMPQHHHYHRRLLTPPSTPRTGHTPQSSRDLGAGYVVHDLTGHGIRTSMGTVAIEPGPSTMDTKMSTVTRVRGGLELGIEGNGKRREREREREREERNHHRRRTTSSTSAYMRSIAGDMGKGGSGFGFTKLGTALSARGVEERMKMIGRRDRVVSVPLVPGDVLAENAVEGVVEPRVEAQRVSSSLVVPRPPILERSLSD